MQYNRGIREKILKLSHHFPVILLTGARQTGKTTLLRALFPTHNYISLDLPSDAELAENDLTCGETRGCWNCVRF